MKKNIIIKTSFPATHHWPECPIEEVSFLRDEHRHVFYVTMKWRVDHNNRQIEFIQQKMRVDEHLESFYANKSLGRVSCEDIAEALLKEFKANYVSVFEDNENGAEALK